MLALRIIGGFFLGLLLAGGTYFLVTKLMGGDTSASLIVALIAGLIGGVYSAIAFAKNIYTVGFFSITGYILDMTWSLLNTAAALLVWLPACAIGGGNYVPSTNDSRRSGTFVYSDNPRGGGYAATTIGTVIAGGWCSHEEVHVWQSRMFGPVYMLVYGIHWVLMLLFRLIVGKTSSVDTEAYGRICYEDMAYWGGALSGSSINWGGWIGGFFLALLCTGLFVAIPVGIATGTHVAWIIGSAGLLIYCLVRALTPRSSP